MRYENRLCVPGRGLGARAVAVSVVGALALAAPAGAQNAKVYVANSANSRILQAQFDPPSTSLVFDAAATLPEVRDLALRDDGLAGTNLIVADRSVGRILFYHIDKGTSAVIFDRDLAAGPTRPDGLSLDAAGNLFVMNADQDGGGVCQVWVVARDEGCPDPQRDDCVGGGYRVPLGLIDPAVQIPTEIGGSSVLLGADALGESLVCGSTSGVFNSGDLLVLAHPGALLRYHALEIRAFLKALDEGLSPAPLIPETVIHPADASVPEGQRFPEGGSPNGMARAPNGELLVTFSDGRILRYGPDGTRRAPDFAGGTGAGDYKIAVGLQDGKSRAFVTQQQGGALRRYSIAVDGTGVLDGVVTGLQSPVGIDSTNSATVPVPTGSGVTVAPTALLTTKIDQVTLAGIVNGSVGIFPDPREQEQTIPPNLPLHRSLFLNELRADFPPIEIPAYARAFRIGDPQTGVPAFIIVETKSNIAVSGLLDHTTVESIILGYEPNCQDPDVTRQPFMFWAPDADDPPIVEGEKFIDVTTGCGSIRGLTRNISYFIAGVRITGPMTNVIAEKLDGLRRVIQSPCIERRSRQRLDKLMDQALRDFSRKRYGAVADALRSIDSQVQSTPGAFSGCQGNTGAEIQARARSAVFMLSKVN